MPKLRCRKRKDRREEQRGEESSRERSASPLWTLPSSEIGSAPVDVRSMTFDEQAAERPAEPPTPPLSEAVCTPQRDSDDEGEKLPKGCVVGTCLPLGLPVSHVPDANHVDLAVRSSIQGDNYKFLRFMLTSEWSWMLPTTCNFSLAISQLEQPEEILVSQASLLHYAICCGSLHAAAALIVAFPEQALQWCSVEMSSGVRRWALNWTALDFASLLCKLYKTTDQHKKSAYDQAFATLLNLHKSIPELAFMRAGTPRERLLAAGDDSRAVVEAFARAVPSSSQPAVEQT